MEKSRITLPLFMLLAALVTITLSPVALSAETIPDKKSQLAPASDEEDFTQDEDFTEDKDEIIVNDPIEPFNRAMFSFNDKAYTYVLKPIAVGYRNVVPEGGRVSIKNFFTNLLAPVRIANSAFQLKGEDATNEFVRFMINTTIGLGGFFDVAKSDFKISMKKEDFGQTMGHYGIGNGAYLVLPLFGPTTMRDGFGQLVDGAAFDPLNIIFDDEIEEYLISRWVNITNELSLDKDTYEAIKRDSIDPYIFLRNAYIQFRAGAVEK